MEEKPLLFINSVNVTKKSNSNQKIFDTRAKKITKIEKLDTIYGLAQKGKYAYCEFLISGLYYEGYIKDLTDTKLIIMVGNKNLEFDLEKLEKVNILKI